MRNFLKNWLLANDNGFKNMLLINDKHLKNRFFAIVKLFKKQTPGK